MEDRVAAYIAENHLLAKGEVVLVAVSGGSDSLSVLHILHQLGYPVVCAHFNHEIRENGEQEEAFVRAAAGEMGVPFVSGRQDVPRHREERKLSMEEAARALRYAYLFEAARLCGAQAVVTGHTADDQAETVLMHFLRGAGLSGLKGMLPRTILNHYDAGIPLVRPLLSIWRTDLLEYLRSKGQRFIVDPSNADLAHFRNRLRRRLLPELERYNPRIKQGLLRMSQVLAGDEQALQAQTQAAWAELCPNPNSNAGWVQLDRQRFLRQPAGIQARLLRMAMDRLRPENRDIDYAAILRGLAVLRAPEAVRECDLLGGLKLMVEYGDAWVAGDWGVLPQDSWPQMGEGAGDILIVPGETRLAGDWRLEAEVAAGLPEGWPADPGHSEVLLDQDRLTGPLKLRARRPGDRITPLGFTSGSIKVTDDMINLKTPPRVRGRWPLLVCGEDVVWIVGKRLGKKYAVGPHTTRFLKLRLFRG